MSQRSTESLIKCPRGYDPAKAHKPSDMKRGFETAIYAQDEDYVRSCVLRRVARELPKGGERSAMERLAADLDGNTVPATLASSRYMRERRKAVIGHLWRVMDAVPTMPRGTVTVMVRGWEIPPDDLHLIDPRRLLEPYRADLNRCGLARADGFAFFGLHGEFNSSTKMFDLHLHGVHVGGVEDVLRALRKRPKYQPAIIECQGARKTVNRVKVSTRPMKDMPHPITYTLQSWWPRRDTFVAGGKVKRSKGRKRIPDFPHAMWLLWMDRWTVSDLTLLVRMRVTKRGLVHVERRTRTLRRTAGI
ncbi:MAG: hypothetical protein HEQ21_07640 [Blastomonas sp.]|uniref:hypothetical protein n=1 Tax=Blastomonas sp. TaxID=1909299 RepID=UPI002584ABE6|nr:hypothetical protein [Blastomonas sp.]MCO5792676.1 hypothetical protein [Blastomonas sp.]